MQSINSEQSYPLSVLASLQHQVIKQQVAEEQATAWEEDKSEQERFKHWLQYSRRWKHNMMEFKAK